MTAIAILAGILAVESLLRERIAPWPLTGPMIFVAAGIALGPDGLAVLDLNLDDESVSLAAELTLALLLFSDAARINTKTLRNSFGVPLRLLGIGLPLTVALGTVIVSMLLSDLSWAEAALIAAILAPTDAALGQAVVANEQVPSVVRQTLNVESGLNDGLVVPAVALFASLANGETVESPMSLVGEALQEIAIGVAIGAATGMLIGHATRWTSAHGWTAIDGVRLATFGGALAGFGVGVALGGNGFVTAFVAGLVLHLVAGEHACHQAELAEDAGQVGAAATFAIFGALMVVPALRSLSWPIVVTVVATLTIVRMLPVALALSSSGLAWRTRLFLGWFGPRGLASMLFGLLLIDERSDGADGLFVIITLTVLASVFLHGISAGPGAHRYARWYAENARRNQMMESEAMPELQLRNDRRKR